MNDRMIRVNGEAEALEREALTDLLTAKGIDPGGRGVAVALNGNVVPRGAWAGTRIAPGDEVEIVQARQGG